MQRVQLNCRHKEILLPRHALPSENIWRWLRCDLRQEEVWGVAARQSLRLFLSNCFLKWTILSIYLFLSPDIFISSHPSPKKPIDFLLSGYLLLLPLSPSALKSSLSFTINGSLIIEAVLVDKIHVLSCLLEESSEAKKFGWTCHPRTRHISAFFFPSVEIFYFIFFVPSLIWWHSPTVKDETSVLLISLMLAYSKALFQMEQLLSASLSRGCDCWQSSPMQRDRLVINKRQ